MTVSTQRSGGSEPQYGTAAPFTEPTDRPERNTDVDGVDSTSFADILDSRTEGAKECARRGFPVFPIEGPEGGGKEPRVVGRRPDGSPIRFAFTRNSTTDLDVIDGWDLDGRGENFGVYAAGADLLILDEDRPGAVEEWAAHLGIAFPPTFTVSTGRGRHLYFRADGTAFSQRDAWPGVNVRHRGYVVGPPSVHETGVVYTVVEDRQPATVPAEVAAALLAEPEAGEPPAHQLASTPEAAAYVARVVPLVLSDLAELAALPEGARNDRGQGWEEAGGLFNAAARLVELSNLDPVGYPLDRAERDYMAAAPRGEERRWADAVDHVGERPAVVPDSSGDFGDLGDDRVGSRDGKRRLVVQRASEIKLRRVLWLWEGRMALGALSLLAGREGLGKSSLVMWLVAMVTRGTLPGHLCGHPRAVIIAATEDSWEHTLVPRLIAAGADLDLVLRVDVMTSRGFTVDLSLPDDIPAVKELAEQERVALMVLDPIMSRLHGLDTHKDSEVRIALEPLVRMADETSMSLIGLIHLNKSSTDPLNAVMGSKAFTAVARSVSTVVPDDSDEDDRRRLFGTVKNNLGPALSASQVYTIETAEVPTEDGPMPVGKLVWHGEVDTTIKAAMADAGMDTRTAVEEAQLWLSDFLADGATFSRKEVVAAAGKVGISESSIKRAASKVGVVSAASGFPRVTFWSLPDMFETDAPGEES